MRLMFVYINQDVLQHSYVVMFRWRCCMPPEAFLNIDRTMAHDIPLAKICQGVLDIRGRRATFRNGLADLIRRGGRPHLY